MTEATPPEPATVAVEVARQRVQRLVAVLVIAVLPWLIAPGRLQPDTKTDLVLSPARYLLRALWAWNDQTGIGELQNQAYGYLWPMGAVFLAGDAVGAPGWATQRVWWSVVLVVAFVGAERLARRVGGVPTVPALLTGLVFALSPRVLTVLAEISVEVWPAALAPWLLLAAHRMVATGASPADRRRGAAVTGLLTVCLGGVNATVSLVALVPAGAWIVLAPAGRSRVRALGWWLGACALGALWWLGPLVVLGRYSYPFLDHIEVAATTTAVASVVNVLRGTQHWIAFILTGGDHPTWQSGWVLAQSVVAIVGTSALAGLGLAGLLRSRAERDPDDEGGRAHLTRWSLVLVLLGVVTMAMGRVGAASGVLAEPVQQLLDGPLAPLRNVHKADLLVRLPIALGVGLLAHWATRVERGAGPLVRQGVVVATVLALVGSLAPLWQGRVGDAWAPRDVPGLWTQVADEVDDMASRDGGTTLVLPGARTADFDWGRVTDEPLRALAASPVLVRAAAPLGHPGATRILDHVDTLGATGRAQPHLAEGLRRLGVSRVVVRGGLSGDLGTVDPRQVAATLAASPGLTRTWVHGEGEARVSIWRLDDPATPATAVPAESVVTAAAAPEGWFALVAAGLLDPRAVTRQPDDERPAVVRTDTLRWQPLNSGRPALAGGGATVVGSEPRPGIVGTKALTATGAADGTSSTWTTRFWSGLSGVDVSSSAASPFAPAWRGAGAGPPALVDGDATTEWVSGDDAPRQRVTLHLEGSAAPDAVLVHEAWGEDLGRLASVSVDGVEGSRPEGSLTWRVPLDGTTREEITLDLEAERGDDPLPVGIREVELDGGPELQTGLTLPRGSGPVLLTRDPRSALGPVAGEDPDDLVRRAGALPPTRIRAMVRLDPGAAGHDLVSAPWTLAGSTLPEGHVSSSDLAEWPVAAVDGDPGTRWRPASGEGEPTLAIDLGHREEVEGIRFDRAVGRIRVETDTDTYVVGSATSLSLPRQSTRHLRITFVRPPGRADWTAPEVTLAGVDMPTGSVQLECTGAGAVRRGDDAVGLSLDASRADLVAGQSVPATSCGELPEGDGTITAAAVPGLVPDAVALVPDDWSPTTADPQRAVSTEREHPGSWTLDVAGGEEAVLVISQGANRGWRAVTADGDELAPVTVDGWRQGFELPAGSATQVHVEFTPNDDHRRALALGALAVGLLALWLLVETVLGRRRRPEETVTEVAHGSDDPRAPTPGAKGRTGAPVAVLLAGLVGLLVAGPLGVVVGLAGALVPARLRAVAAAVVLAVAGVLLCVLGVADRQSAGAWVAQGLGTFILGLLAAGLVHGAGDAREPAAATRPASTTDGPAPH